MENTFASKWAKLKRMQRGAGEPTLFVDIGREPETQRQLNLYYYFLFVRGILECVDAKTILELGCGRGTLSLYLSKYLGLSVSLLDSSVDAIDLAKRDFNKHNKQAAFYVRDALHTGFKNQTFDGIVSIGLAEHFDSLENVSNLFREQYRLLKEGGVMVSLNIPKKFSIQFLNHILRFSKKITGQYSGDIKKDYYRNSFNPREYYSAAERAGFQCLSIVHVCPFPIYVPIKTSTDKKVATINKFILRCRKLFQTYPYKTNYFMSQAHFLVGYKKGH